MPTFYDGVVKTPGIARRTPDSSFVPTDFDDLFRNYYIYTVRLVSKAGIDFQNAEDVASIILTKAFEHGLIADFDPTAEYNGRKAVFTTFLAGFVLKYVRHYRDRQKLQLTREGQSTDVEITVPGKSSSEPTIWIDEYGPTMEETYDDLHHSDFLVTVRAHLTTAALGRKDSQLNLTAFFNAIAEQVEVHGQINTSELMDQFSVSRTTIHNWMSRLRDEVGFVVERDR